MKPYTLTYFKISQIKEWLCNDMNIDLYTFNHYYERILLPYIWVMDEYLMEHSGLTKWDDMPTPDELFDKVTELEEQGRGDNMETICTRNLIEPMRKLRQEMIRLDNKQFDTVAELYDCVN